MLSQDTLAQLQKIAACKSRMGTKPIRADTLAKRQRVDKTTSQLKTAEDPGFMERWAPALGGLGGVLGGAGLGEIAGRFAYPGPVGGLIGAGLGGLGGGMLGTSLGGMARDSAQRDRLGRGLAEEQAAAGDNPFAGMSEEQLQDLMYQATAAGEPEQKTAGIADFIAKHPGPAAAVAVPGSIATWEVGKQALRDWQLGRAYRKQMQQQGG